MSAIEAKSHTVKKDKTTILDALNFVVRRGALLLASLTLRCSK